MVKLFRFGFGQKCRPVSVSVFRFSPFSVFQPKHYFRPKQAVSSKLANFCLTFQYKVNCQNSLLWTKMGILAETGYFRRKRDSAKFRFWLKFQLFPGALFWFQCFGQKSVSFDHYFIQSYTSQGHPLSFFLSPICCGMTEGVFMQFEWVTFSFLPNQTDTDGQRDNGGKRRDKIGR